MKKRFAGIDFGSVRLGLAISDESKIIAQPLTTALAAKRMEETCSRVLATLAPYEVEKIILGMPLRLNGTSGQLADDVKLFAELLRANGHLVILWDERLTTLQAERSLKEANMRRKKRAKIIDSITAVILLQSYLDFERMQ